VDNCCLLLQNYTAPGLTARNLLLALLLLLLLLLCIVSLPLPACK
jgi:hypothetical protein